MWAKKNHSKVQLIAFNLNLNYNTWPDNYKHYIQFTLKYTFLFY